MYIYRNISYGYFFKFNLAKFYISRTCHRLFLHFKLYHTESHRVISFTTVACSPLKINEVYWFYRMIPPYRFQLHESEAVDVSYRKTILGFNECQSANGLLTDKSQSFDYNPGLRWNSATKLKKSSSLQPSWWVITKA